MLKKQEAEIIEDFGTQMKSICDEQPYLMMLIAKSCEARNEALAQILNLFKAEVDKLTVIGQDPVAIAQLQHTKKQLLDLMGE